MYVYLLGAGASRPDGVPTTPEIFGAAVRNVDMRRDDGSYPFASTESPFEGAAILEFGPVFELFDQWEGTSLAPRWKSLTKEKYLPYRLSVDTCRFEHFYSKLYRINRGFEPSNLDSEFISDVWRKATWLFYHTIGSAGWHDTNSRCYQAFVERILMRPGFHRIISFNIDTLLDSCLYLHECERQLEWDYGVGFAVRNGMQCH